MVLRIVQPETVFKWHRELVRRKWTFQQPSRGGRPRTAPDLEQLVVRLARENPGWGNARIEGELTKLGYALSDETGATILKRHGIPPAPQRDPSPSWQNLMTHYRDQILACDFFYRRNALPANDLRPVLHRAKHASGLCGWLAARLQRHQPGSCNKPDN
jgi:hypothetical protein